MVVKKTRKDISSKFDDPSVGFIKALNKKLGPESGDNVLTRKEVGALTKVISENDAYFITHEHKSSPAMAAFSLYNVNNCCDTPVLRIMQSQIPSSSYKVFVGLVSSPDNRERAEFAGIVKPGDENEYFSNTDDFDE
jgi:hypothetical protein